MWVTTRSAQSVGGPVFMLKIFITATAGADFWPEHFSAFTAESDQARMQRELAPPAGLPN